VADELGRWAAARAPELLARAEAEAVAAMRDALIAAALPRAQAAPAPRPTAAEPAPTPQQGDALWVYCVLRAGGPPVPEAEGVAGGRIELVEGDGLAALVSRVPLAQFGEEPLRRNLNELPWLERVARAHEAVLEHALAVTTIAPLRLCTIYEREDRVQAMLDAGRERFLQTLEVLEGRQEWGLKLLLDAERLTEEARRMTPEAEAHDAELAGRGEGAGYMLRRRQERQIAETAESLAADIAHQVHARVQDWAVDAVTRPPQNRELSGHEGDMALNAAYLVEADRVDGLRELVAELEAHHRAAGARIELTGPWPPYNFVLPGGAEALT
jgi:hypothetical protein